MAASGDFFAYYIRESENGFPCKRAGNICPYRLTAEKGDRKVSFFIHQIYHHS